MVDKIKTKGVGFWLDEKELKTPKHDELVIWTFNNAEKIIKDLGVYPKGSFYLNEFEGREPYSYSSYKKNFEEWKKDRESYYFIEKDIQEIKLYESQIKDYEILKKEWEKNPKDIINKELEISFEKIIEYPLQAYNGFNLGFLDLLVSSNINLKSNKLRLEIEYDTLGYVNHLQKFKYAFEIKPEVKSIGEVLRQFQFYKSNLPKGTILILVTKTRGLKDIFESQGFYVVEYNDEENKLQQGTLQ